MAFLDELTQGTNYTTTENGALTHVSSLNACLDFFALGGAKRNDLEGGERLFAKALSEDAEKAIRTVFYFRDIRGGQGERTVCRAYLRELYKIKPQVFKQIISFVPEYGRWDDLIDFVDCEEVQQLIKNQWEQDLDATHPSLLAKWLPSHNTSSAKTRKKGRQWAAVLCGGDVRKYRKALSRLRATLRVLERDMTAGRWGAIQYSSLPSQALRKHTAAFWRNDERRYSEYLDNVKKGTAKVNASTLYTYEVYDLLHKDETTAEVLWQNLPIYTQDNALVVADVSGSMMGRPMSVSVSLALYFAEHNKGTFAGKFMTFSRRPHLVSVVGDTLKEKVSNIERADWDMDTNIEAVFDVILNAAVNSRATQEDLPKVVYIVSDMEFNECSNPSQTIFDNAREKFEAKGYSLPTLVFWNVNARSNAVPVTAYDNNVVLVSGCSQTVFDMAVSGKNPIECMHDVLNSERYSQIKIN